MTDVQLTARGRQTLDAFVREKREEEMAHAKRLFEHTRSRLQIARAYSAYLSEWEQTKSLMQGALKSATLPPDTSASLYRAMIDESEQIVEDKLEFMQIMFEVTFGVSIFKYLHCDATSSRWFGLFG